MINDYPELILEVSHRSGIEGIADRAAMYVGMAERYLSKELRLLDQEVEATLATDANGKVALPSDFLEVRLVEVAGKSLQKLPLNTVKRRARAGYAVSGNTLVSTKFSTDHEVTYFKGVPSLVTDNTSWLLTDEPEMYLQAVLFQVYSAKEDFEKAVFIQGYLDTLIDRANRRANTSRHFGLRTVL